MNPDSQNFQELRQLLAVKRHEQPPPGYFEDFSGQIITRIQSGEQGSAASWRERLFGEGSWVRNLWGALEARPALAGAFGMAVCALLVSGVVYSENGAPVPVIGSAAGDTGSSLVSAAPAVALNQPLTDQSELTSSTNPIPSSLNAVFEQAQQAALPFSGQPRVVNFDVPAGN